MFRQRMLVENAVNKALDAEGWPAGERGTVPVATAYWYVNLTRQGQIQGHVGPIVSKEQANRCAMSWRDGGTRARVSVRPLGPCLTNAGLTNKDIYWP